MKKGVQRLYCSFQTCASESEVPTQAFRNRLTVVKIQIFTLIYRTLCGITAGFIPANIVMTKKDIICDGIMQSSLTWGALKTQCIVFYVNFLAYQSSRIH